MANAIQPVFFFALSLALLSSPRPVRAENPYLQTLLQTAHEKNLAEDRYWRLLLHVRPNVFRRLQSEVDDPRFFLAPGGRYDPQAELDATLKAFFEPAVEESGDVMHPQCRFPARFAWLRDQLQFDSRLPVQPCTRFETWKSRMNADSVSLIFASYYMNNPASMYGHTFLRLNAPNRRSGEHLTDYAVNYGANVDTRSGVLFAIYGLTGRYRGAFATVPYYVKVQEYNNMESRDLWEYQLRLEAEAMDRLVRHLWELGSATMAYYFLNKNCSYEMLPLLEVAQPSLHLTEPFWLKTTPVDTLRAIAREPGLLEEVDHRASLVSLMLQRRSLLSPAERDVAAGLARRGKAGPLEALRRFPPERQALVLDSAYDLFRFRVGFRRPQPAEVMNRERDLLLMRNERPTGAPLSPAPGPVRPDQGHATGRLGLSYGVSDRSHFEDVSIRPAADDEDDSADGYQSGSRLEMFHLKLRYDHDRRALYLQQLAFVDLVSLTPWDSWIRAPSWRFNFGLRNADDLHKDPENSLFFGGQVGAGPSWRLPLFKSTLVYSMAEIDTGLGMVFRDVYRIGGGGTAGVTSEVTSWLRTRFQAHYLNYPVGEPGSAVRLEWAMTGQLTPRTALRVQLQRQNQSKEALCSLLWSI